jgi:hypothetical protein
LVSPRTTAREIYVTDGVVAHYRKQHKGQCDIDAAEAMVPMILSDPHRVYQGQKQKTLVFTEIFHGRFVLIVPVKCNPHAMWQETLYIYRRDDFESRSWVKAGLLYLRKE